MAKPVSNLRLFVAIHPPAEMVRQLFEALDALTLPPHRRTPVEQVHLTLQFIGDVPAKDLDRTVESAKRASSGLAPFDLTVQTLITLPERGPKRLVAAEADRPATLLELQRRLAVRLASKPRSRREGDRFRPHFTLCRFRRPTRMEPLEAALSPQTFTVAGIALMRSTLRPDGARHEPVRDFALDESARA